MVRKHCLCFSSKPSLFCSLPHKGSLFSLSFSVLISFFYIVFVCLFIFLSVCFSVSSLFFHSEVSSLPRAVLLCSHVLTSDTSAAGLIATCTSCQGSAWECECVGSPGCISPAPAPPSASPWEGRLSCRLGLSTRSRGALWCVPGAGRSAGARLPAAGSWGALFVRAGPACGQWAAAGAAGAGG